MSFYILGRKCTTKDREISKRKYNCTFSTNNTTKQRFKTKENLDFFSCSKNGPEAYKCFYCDFKTDFLVEFNKHVAKTKMKPLENFCKDTEVYICDKCNFETFSRLILLKHALVNCTHIMPNSVMILASCKSDHGAHKQIKLFLCDRSGLKIKIPPCARPKPYYPKSIKNYVCEMCPFQTTSKTSIKEHTIRKHTAEEDVNWYQCDHCPYKAKFQYNLDKHRFKLHTALEKKIWFQCPECPYRSIWKPDYLKHYSRVHAVDAKWYKCEKCSHKTKYRTHFKRHMKEQHSENFKWLQCDHCPYKAKQKIHMKLHVVQKHTAVEDIEWYECEKCSYKAKIKASLKNHILKKHVPSEQINWFVCEKCGYKAREKSLLKKHFEKKHK